MWESTIYFMIISILQVFIEHLMPDILLVF